MMKTSIYYFSGTGNTLSIAKKLSEKLSDSQIISIPHVINSSDKISDEVIGIVTPIYMHNVPHIVADFIKKIKEVKYIFFVFTGSGELGVGIKVTKKIFDAQNVKLDSLFNIPMPSNYTPYGCWPEEKQKIAFENADKKIDEVVEIVNKKEKHFDSTHTSFFKTYIHPGLLYKLGHTQIPVMDKAFSTDEKCNGCALCQKVCPVNNITMKDNKPVWNHKCQQCYACMQWCPTISIQAGKKTIGIKRYHHPNITAKDIINASPK